MNKLQKELAEIQRKTYRIVSGADVPVAIRESLMCEYARMESEDEASRRTGNYVEHDDLATFPFD